MNSSGERMHLSQDLLFLVLDDELSPDARREAEAHLAVCEICRRDLAGLHEFSLDIETALQTAPVPVMTGVRNSVRNALEARPASPLLLHPGKVMRRFGWGMGIAATLAVVLMTASRHHISNTPDLSDNREIAAGAQAGTMEVDGETFWSVPYSNADLSTAAPHIVQMQVPVSSLADIGIVLEPVTSRVISGSDQAGPEQERSVLADVLVGADGQPRGVHVLSNE